MTILRSYRWRRRLTITGLVLAVGAPLIYLGVHFSSPGNPGNPTGPDVPESGYAQPKPAPFTKAKQQAVHRVLREFISTAVVRNDVPGAWDLVAPSLREGFTRKEWNNGDIPVVPYPAANKGWGRWDFVEYSYTHAIGLEVFLLPKPGSGYSALTADVELVKGRRGRWLVDYWMPKKFHGPPALAAGSSHRKRTATGKKHKLHGTGKRAAPSAMPAIPKPHRPSRIWWAVPIGVLSLLFLAPLSLGLAAWYRNRKAQQEYLRSRRT